MKYIYTFIIALAVLVSCNDVKTSNTLQNLTQKAEKYNNLKKASLEVDFTNLENTAALDDTFKSDNEIATAVNTLASNYFNYLDSVKNHVKEFKPTTGKETVINSLEKEFFKKKKLTQVGKSFLERLKYFKQETTILLENEFVETQQLLDSLFNTEPISVLNGQKEEWLSYQFKGITNVVALANLTVMQSNVLSIESNLMAIILGDSQVNANTFRVDVVLEKSKYYPGDKVRGKLFINKMADNLMPKSVVLNGNDVERKNFKDGEVAIEFTAPKQIGDHPVEGELVIEQGDSDLTLYFDKTFNVVARPKKAAVVKKEDKNNPSKVNAKVLSKPAAIGILSKPIITIRGKAANSRGVIKLTKDKFRLAPIDAVFSDSDYKTIVTEFSFKPSNQPTIKIYGNTLTTKAISILNKSRRGRKFKIFNVKVKLKINSKYRVKTPETIDVEIIN